MKSQKGFTLIELIVVICIMGILLLIAVNRYDHWQQNYNLRSEARIICGYLQEASSLARSKSLNYNVIFDMEKNSYGIVAGEDIKIYNFSDPRVRLVSADFTGESYVTFLPRGCVQDTGTVLLENALGSTVLIHVALPGKISIQLKMK